MIETALNCLHKKLINENLQNLNALKLMFHNNNNIFSQIENMLLFRLDIVKYVIIMIICVYEIVRNLNFQME